MRELGPDREYPLDIALAGSDLQQRDDRAYETAATTGE